MLWEAPAPGPEKTSHEKYLILWPFAWNSTCMVTFLTTRNNLYQFWIESLHIWFLSTGLLTRGRATNFSEILIEIQTIRDGGHLVSGSVYSLNVSTFDMWMSFRSRLPISYLLLDKIRTYRSCVKRVLVGLMFCLSACRSAQSSEHNMSSILTFRKWNLITLPVIR